VPDEDKNFGGCFVLDFRKWWRHVKTIYSVSIKQLDYELEISITALILLTILHFYATHYLQQ